MRRDGEDELDLADIGGQSGAATHDVSIAQPDRRQKGMDGAKRPWDRPGERTRNVMPASSKLMTIEAERRLPVGIRIGVRLEDLAAGSIR